MKCRYLRRSKPNEDQEKVVSFPYHVLFSLFVNEKKKINAQQEQFLHSDEYFIISLYLKMCACAEICSIC